jgi:hypothetical protein
MKRISLILATAAMAFAPLLSQAATLSPGDLIKGSISSVYYYGVDNKRYVFPTEKTYKTWYANFDSVKTVTDAELGGLMIGGNITYRPGVRLVKITTDPKVYAVGANGTLRWIQTEGVARDLYGVNWSTMVDDVPDAFFINYRIGAPIASATDYSVSQETALASSIAVDRGLISPVPPPPAPTSTTPTTTTPTVSPYSGTMELSSNNAPVNETINIYANATRASEISAVSLFFDGVLYKRCEYSPCSSDVQMIGTKPTVDAVARFDWIMGQRAYVTSTVSLQSGGVPGITITVTRPEVRMNGMREVLVSADNSFIAKTIDIFIDGNNVRGCTDIQQCRYAGEELSPVGTVHSVYAILRDTNGFAQQTEVKQITVVENEHPYVTLETGRSTILRGEQVDVTVRATDDNGLAWTEIWVDDILVKHCNTSICTADIGPWSVARQVRAVGKAQDTMGFIGYGTSTTVFVQ